MILDKEVKIKFKGNSKISFYKDLGYDIISGKDFYVLVKDLLPTSTSIVQAKCDFCENIVFVTYKNYYRNFNRSSHGKYSCSKSCSNKKTEKTNEQTSIKEKELLDFIKKSYKGVVLQSYRDNLEIDIYLPDLKLGFEFNGLYWHSEEYNIKIKTTI